MGSTKKYDGETYEDIYDGAGFYFDYNRQLSHSKDIPLFVNCKACDTFMDFIPGNDGPLTGKWKCPICGKSVRESTVYEKLNRENDHFEDELREEIPEGCIACGGPWPDCESSCKLIDD